MTTHTTDNLFLNRFIFHDSKEKIESLRLYLFQEIEKMKQIGTDPEFCHLPSFFEIWEKNEGEKFKTEVLEEYPDDALFWDMEFTTTHRFGEEFYDAIQKQFKVTGCIVVLKVGCVSGMIRDFVSDEAIQVQRLKIPSHVTEFPKLIKKESAFHNFITEMGKVHRWTKAFENATVERIAKEVSEEMRLGELNTERKFNVNSKR